MAELREPGGPAVEMAVLPSSVTEVGRRLSGLEWTGLVQPPAARQRLWKNTQGKSPNMG